MMPQFRSEVICRIIRSIVRLKTEQRRHRTSLFNTGFRTEAGFAVSHSALKVVVEAVDYKDELLGNSVSPEYAA